MAKATIDFPLKPFIEVNKILKLYFTEYIINDKMIFGDSLMTEVRRMAVLTDPTMTLNNVIIQPNATQRELTAYRISKDKYNETDEGYEFRHLVEPEKGSNEKFDPYYPDDADLIIHKWKNEAPITKVYEIPSEIEDVWKNISSLNFISVDESVYDAFDNDSVAQFTLADKNGDPYDLIFTRQLFPSYDKADIQVANVNMNSIASKFGIRYSVFASIFDRVVIYTLVASM